MTVNTPNYQIPYPEGTDFVKNGATAMGSIATKVDTLLAGGQFMGGFRNKLINGDMLIWQRGTGTFTASNGYSADRWVQSFSGGTFSTTRVGLSSAELGIFPYGRSMMQMTVAGGALAANYAIMTQRIEFVGSLAGKTVTVSFWAKAASGTPKVGMSFDQAFGTGGSPSAVVVGTGQSVTISTTLTRYSKTFTVPAITGKTLGTGGDDYLALNLWLSAGTDFASRSGTVGVQSSTITIVGVQVEAGAQPTDYEVRPFQVELALCQRYYEKTYPLGITPGAVSSAGLVFFGGGADAAGNVMMPVRFAVPKRSLTYTTTAWSEAANINVWDIQRSGASSLSTLYFDVKSEGGMRVYVNIGAAWVVGLIFGHWVANAEL